MAEKQFKVCFVIDEETDCRVKNLPRKFKLSEKLREALANILSEAKSD